MRGPYRNDSTSEACGGNQAKRPRSRGRSGVEMNRQAECLYLQILVRWQDLPHLVLLPAHLTLGWAHLDDEGLPLRIERPGFTGELLVDAEQRRLTGINSGTAADHRNRFCRAPRFGVAPGWAPHTTRRMGT